MLCWTPPVLIRAISGWSLDWGDVAIYNVLCFRADLSRLWCSKPDMLVHDVWDVAQHLPGRTFASVSKQLLSSISFQEIFEFPGWQEYVQHGKPIMPIYKKKMRQYLAERSIAKWRADLLACATLPIHVQAVRYPVSVGSVFLQHGLLHALCDAEAFGKLQLGRFKYAAVSHKTGRKGCVLCCGADFGLAHVLASCSELSVERDFLLHAVDEGWRCTLLGSPHGDWPTAVLSPHQGVLRLQHAARYASSVVRKLCDEGASSS